MVQKMFSLVLSLLSPPKKQNQRPVDPTKFLYKYSQDCDSCKKKVIYSNSMGICECKLYGHQQCIAFHLNSLQLKQKDEVICFECKKHIQITYEKETKLGVNVSLENSLIIILIIIAMTFLVEEIMQEFKIRPQERNLISLGFQFFMMAVLVVGLALLIVYSLAQVKFKVKEVKKSKKQIIVSAFEGVLTQPDDENSSNVIFH